MHYFCGIEMRSMCGICIYITLTLQMHPVVIVYGGSYPDVFVCPYSVHRNSRLHANERRLFVLPQLETYAARTSLHNIQLFQCVLLCAWCCVYLVHVRQTNVGVFEHVFICRGLVFSPHFMEMTNFSFLCFLCVWASFVRSPASARMRIKST